MIHECPKTAPDWPRQPRELELGDDTVEAKTTRYRTVDCGSNTAFTYNI